MAPMIRLKKGPKPEVLVERAELWTREYLEALASGDKKKIKAKRKRYNHSQIKEALISETKAKCAYCESSVTAVAHGDIEHITPKSLEPQLTFEWSNLTFSCQICNQNKSNKEDVLDPYDADPAKHIFFFGHIARGMSERGTLTIRRYLY